MVGLEQRTKSGPNIKEPSSTLPGSLVHFLRVGDTSCFCKRRTRRANTQHDVVNQLELENIV
jgi:hypothetical protein